MESTRGLNERPTRPLSAYNLWFRHERQRLMQEKHEMVKALGFTGMAKYIGKRWRSVSEEEKRKFKELAVIEKKRYERAMAVWYKEQEEFMRRIAAGAEEQAQDYPSPLKSHDQQEPQFGQIEPLPLHAEAATFTPNDEFGIPMSSAPQVPGVGAFANTHAPQLAYANEPMPYQMPPHHGQDEELTPGPSHAGVATRTAIHFDEHSSLDRIAQAIGNDGIDYLLSVFKQELEGCRH